MSAADAFQKALSNPLDEAIARVTLTVDEKQAVKDCIEAGDLVALSEAIEFFELDDSDLVKLLDDPFTPKDTEDGGKSFWPSRFSAGDFGIYYGALEVATAAAEYGYHAPKWYDTHMGKFEVRLHVIECHAKGKATDLRPLVGHYPELVADTYEFCQEIGVAAKDSGVDALLSRSARAASGNTVPVLVRASLDNPTKVRDVIYEIDAPAQKATFRLV